MPAVPNAPAPSKSNVLLDMMMLNKNPPTPQSTPSSDQPEGRGPRSDLNKTMYFKMPINSSEEPQRDHLDTTGEAKTPPMPTEARGSRSDLNKTMYFKMPINSSEEPERDHLDTTSEAKRSPLPSPKNTLNAAEGPYQPIPPPTTNAQGPVNNSLASDQAVAKEATQPEKTGGIKSKLMSFGSTLLSGLKKGTLGAAGTACMIGAVSLLIAAAPLALIGAVGGFALEKGLRAAGAPKNLQKEYSLLGAQIPQYPAAALCSVGVDCFSQIIAMKHTRATPDSHMKHP